EELNQNISDIHQYIRTSIENLREPVQEDLPWMNAIYSHMEMLENEADLHIEKSIDVDESLLSSAETGEKASCVGEALVNIHKHAQATKVMMEVKVTEEECYLTKIGRAHV